MEPQRMTIRIPVRLAEGFEEEKLIGIFHDWIRRDALPERLIDVADYQHVPQGPGIMLVSHEVHFALDHSDGDAVLAQQRRPVEGPLDQRLLDLVAAATRVAAGLAAEKDLEGRLEVDAGCVEWQSFDRLRAPNDDAAWTALEPALRKLAGTLYGKDARVERVVGHPGDPLTARLQATAPVDIATLLARAGG